MSCAISLDSLHTNYYHPELKFWSNTLRLPDDRESTHSKISPRASRDEIVQKLVGLWEGSVSASVELSDCSVGAYQQPPEQFRDFPTAKVVLASATANMELSPLENEDSNVRQMK